MLHLSLCCKNGFGSNLWPMDTSYDTYIYDHTPNAKEIATADLFTGTKLHHHNLEYIHVWGCPVYVLETTLQKGRKLPKRHPQSCCGIFTGLSPNHSSDVPLVFNPDNGHIYTQFHMIFDDHFSTVLYISTEE